MADLLVTFKPVIMAVHFFAVFFLIGVILLQAGKGTDIGTMFGAGGSQSLFGARGAATLLSKLTTATAIIFLITSLGLGTIDNYHARGGGSVIDAEESPAATSLDAAEEAKPVEVAPVPVSEPIPAKTDGN